MLCDDYIQCIHMQNISCNASGWNKLVVVLAWIFSILDLCSSAPRVKGKYSLKYLKHRRTSERAGGRHTPKHLYTNDDKH